MTGARWPGTADGLRDLQPILDRLVEPEPARRTWTDGAVSPPDDLAGALLAKLATWGLRAGPIKRWQDGYLVELAACPWSHEHTTGPGGAAVLIRARGAYDFVCLHAHCGARTWRDLRIRMEAAR